MSIDLKRIAGAALLVAAIAGSWGVNAAKKSHDSAVARNLNVFNALVKELEMNYVDTIRTDESFSTAIRALLSTVDPYTEYYSSDDAENLAKMTTGEYGGIGSYILQRDSFVYISGPYEGSPAALAGLKAGDRIVRIDTADAKGMASDKVSKLLRGPAGTIVNLRLERPYAGPDSVIEVAVERRKIQTPSVPYSRLDPETGIGYIRLTTFIDKSPKEVETALDSFRNDPRLKGVVLDLRGNGGGLLESAVQIVGNFVPKGTEVVRTRGREQRHEKVYKTTQQPLDLKLPVAVLTDNGTASASEIVAGSLQDLDRAVIVGDRSYGKGLVQTTRPLPYNDLMKLTTGRYYIPSGRLIQALDYSHRNPDGSPARTPDSLTNEFRTRAGRIVRDGGGITPDATVDLPEGNRLLYNIVADMWDFDFANRYRATHPSIAPADSFAITDEIFQSFKDFIDPARFKYDRQCETGLDFLRKAAKSEGYMTDSVAAQFDILASMLKHDLSHDLDINRQEIEGILADAISSRYYSDADRVRLALRSDSVMERAAAILLNKGAYEALLAPASK